MVKRCLWCGREFETKNSRKKYCNYEHFVLDRPEQFTKPHAAIARYHLMADEMIETMKRVSKELKPIKR